MSRLAAFAFGALAVLAVTARPAFAAPRFADPAPYCSRFRDLDGPGPHYRGPAVPDWVAQSLRRASGAAADAPIDVFRRARWRCMRGKVVACLYGANIPCDEKADRRRKPSQGAIAFCRDNPSADVVPAYATGRATVYAWRCQDGRPVIERQVLEVDRRGYAAQFWYRVSRE